MKTVKIQGKGRQLGCGDTFEALATSCSIKLGTRKPGSGVAKDWVTGLSYSFEVWKRVNVQSGGIVGTEKVLAGSG